ncbi:MAG: L,D-transpeptidase family protein [Verrucomicrobiota bacterium]|nr:L,D-transpeptidase family protein [Verrucomicrobiota bacterium]
MIRPPRMKIERTADRVVVEKSARKLTLLRGDVVLKTYRVALGGTPIGHKQEEGDGRTPEGVYQVDFHKPDSGYHLALHISYPNAQDRERAAARGVSAGGDVMIHGLRNGTGALGAAHRVRDWTAGCIAVTDEEIEELWRKVPDGTAIEILP